MSIKREYNFDQVGQKDMYLLHHEEIESLAKNIPEAKRIRFFMTFGQSYLDHMRCLEDVGMLSTTPINFNGQEIVPIQFLKALLPDPASLGPRTKGKTNIGCIFTGKKDGKEKTYYIYNVCDHQECYKEVGSQAISYTTGVPAMCGALMLLTGKWTTKGVHTVEEFDPDPYLDALDKYSLPAPCYLLDEAQLRRNGKILLGVQQRTGCKILLAQKAFSNFDLYPLLAPCLAGTEASGLYESRLGKEELPEKENHVFCAAYRVDEFNELLDYADHIVFNSPAQLAKFGPAAKAAGKSVGLRINPERSTQEGHAIYDPCAPGSRLGTTRAQWDAALAKQPGLAALLDGLHFHTLCEQDADALAVTLDAVEEKFGDLLPGLKWLNFGGGHHITRPGYDLATLEACIARIQEKYGVQVYLEPGEAWALNAGYLVTTVLDTLQNGDTSLAVLDMSAACHTPDVIEMPYRPPLLDAGEPGEKPCTIRLGGPTCLAGDVVGDYSFDAPLAEGDRLIFGDMAIYTTCKNNTFNGMPLPPIWALAEDGTCRELVRFGYNDFKMRLGHRA